MVLYELANFTCVICQFGRNILVKISVSRFNRKVISHNGKETSGLENFKFYCRSFFKNRILFKISYQTEFFSDSPCNSTEKNMQFYQKFNCYLCTSPPPPNKNVRPKNNNNTDFLGRSAWRIRKRFQIFTDIRVYCY